MSDSKKPNTLEWVDGKPVRVEFDTWEEVYEYTRRKSYNSYVESNGIGDIIPAGYSYEEYCDFLERMKGRKI